MARRLTPEEEAELRALVLADPVGCVQAYMETATPEQQAKLLIGLIRAAPATVLDHLVRDMGTGTIIVQASLRWRAENKRRRLERKARQDEPPAPA